MMDAEDLAILAETDPEQIWHVYPVNDLREHITLDAQNHPLCWCNPTLELEGAGVVLVHNSADGREAFETGERKPS